MNQSKFKIATFNAYNLVLPNITYYSDREYLQPEYDRKVDWMAGQLRRMDADIIAFQEIFHEAAFRDVISQSGIYEDAFCYVPEPIKAELGPLTALVTRLPVLQHGSIARFPQEARLEFDGQIIPATTFSRPVIWAQIQISEEFTFTVFVLHLKSKRAIISDEADRDDPRVIAAGRAKALLQRAAEALALRVILVKLLREAQMPVIILGDFNDTAHAVTNTIISGAPPWRYSPPDEAGQPRDLSLYNVLNVQTERSQNDRQHTHTYLGFRNTLDHIFVSDEFIRANPDHAAYVDKVQVFNDHLPDETGGEEIPDWQSDHGQVAATFVT